MKEILKFFKTDSIYRGLITWIIYYTLPFITYNIIFQIYGRPYGHGPDLHHFHLILAILFGFGRFIYLWLKKIFSTLNHTRIGELIIHTIIIGGIISLFIFF